MCDIMGDDVHDRRAGQPAGRLGNAEHVTHRHLLQFHWPTSRARRRTVGADTSTTPPMRISEDGRFALAGDPPNGLDDLRELLDSLQRSKHQDTTTYAQHHSRRTPLTPALDNRGPIPLVGCPIVWHALVVILTRPPRGGSTPGSGRVLRKPMQLFAAPNRRLHWTPWTETRSQQREARSKEVMFGRTELSMSRSMRKRLPPQLASTLPGGATLVRERTHLLLLHLLSTV